MPLPSPLHCAPLYETLKRIEDLHDACADQALQNLYLKLALLELCGWLEEIQDQALRQLASYWLTNCSADFERQIKGNYGFSYTKHFRELLGSLIGYKGVERVERRLEQHSDPLKARIFLQMKNDLDNSISPRNTHAHTFAGLKTAPLQNLLHFSRLRDIANVADIGTQLIITEVSGC
jgi:hypothetical protein